VWKEEDILEENLKKTGRKYLKMIGWEEKPRKKITFSDQRFCYNFISLLAA